jgi:heme exporter protein D
VSAIKPGKLVEWLLRRGHEVEVDAEWIAVIVGFIAAIVTNVVSLVNVKTVQRGEREKWLREAERGLRRVSNRQP